MKSQAAVPHPSDGARWVEKVGGGTADKRRWPSGIQVTGKKKRGVILKGIVSGLAREGRGCE